MAGLRHVSTWVFGEDGDLLDDSATQSLVFASGVLMTGTILLSPLIADLSVVFAVSEATAGWMIIGFTAASAVTLPVVGALADQVGRKSVLVAGLFLFGVAGAAAGVVRVFEVVMALRVLQGIGYAASMPIIITLFGDLYSGSREATVQGMRVSANSLSNAVVPLAAGVLFLQSWRHPFLVYLIAIPSAAWIWRSVPRIEGNAERGFGEYLQEIAVFMADAKIAALLLSFLFRFVLIFGIITYISVLAVREAGLAVVAVGALLTLHGLIKTVSSTQVGRLSASFGLASLALASFLFVAGGTVLMGAVPSVAAIAVGLVVVGIADGILSPCQKSLVNQIAPDDYRGGAMSAALTFQNVGKVVGPVAVGALLGVFGPAAAFVAIGLVGGTLGVGATLVVWTLAEL